MECSVSVWCIDAWMSCAFWLPLPRGQWMEAILSTLFRSLFLSHSHSQKEKIIKNWTKSKIAKMQSNVAPSKRKASASLCVRRSSISFNRLCASDFSANQTLFVSILLFENNEQSLCSEKSHYYVLRNTGAPSAKGWTWTERQRNAQQF